MLVLAQVPNLKVKIKNVIKFFLLAWVKFDQMVKSVNRCKIRLNALLTMSNAKS